MKCLLCESTIDELKEFPPAVGPSGQSIDDVAGRVRHAQTLEKWRQLHLTAQVRGGSLSLLSGHVCPDHDLSQVGVCVAAPAATETPRKKP